MPQNPPNNPALLDIEKILKILPHRYPFLLVDRVLEIEKGKFLVAIKNVTYNEEFFQGHFPVVRVMPGIFIVEAMAQAGGILIHQSIPDPEGKIFFLSKIDNTKFRKPVVPGDQLRLEVEIIKMRSRICHAKGRALVDGEIVAEGEVFASLMDSENLNE
ncbi:MAG: 3-hydroxyacyl-ACP dehydratase FabZ [Candidatus Aminicenantes bacterium]|jgi:3-hydroxyacyl-[acyl-carrier-protein] dehydratase/UDP-3-O-[3-hydroxymyristoyl] N-acetylglucosamine deacetylase/3-hydroxyacyl-[acyl-carrier-protein] dehydratase